MIDNWITPDWPVPPTIHAASTFRVGGVSTGAYTSWNLATHVDDAPAHVNANRQLLQQHLRLPAEPVWLNQVHGCRVIEADKITAGVTADASYSWQPGIVCVVMTADCLPLLLCTEEGAGIAAVHCGWRGLLAGIIEQTRRNIGTSDLLAWMGPAIGSQAFEVGAEVRQLFINKSQDYARAFIEQDDGKFLADIYTIAGIGLRHAGISRVYGGDRCTFNESDHFFSYRRQGETGRMATLIWRD